MAEIVQEFYSDFINVEHSTLFDLMLAASYMQIQPLVDLTCASVAAMIKGKTPEQIRSHFSIVYDDDDDDSDDNDVGHDDDDDDEKSKGIEKKSRTEAV